MTEEERNFEEDETCDDCCMEIWGPAIPSGFKPGEKASYGQDASGWMHKRKSECDANRDEEEDLRRWQDGHYVVPPRAPKR